MSSSWICGTGILSARCRRRRGHAARPRPAPCREKAVRRAPALRAVAPAPKESRTYQHLLCAAGRYPTGPYRAALRCRFAPPPIRLRRPYNAENYSPRALQRIELLSLQTLPALASACCHSRRGPVPDFYLN
jgi:hypothetical protein